MPKVSIAGIMHGLPEVMENLNPGEELEITKYNKGTNVFLQRRNDKKASKPKRQKLIKQKRAELRKGVE